MILYPKVSAEEYAATYDLKDLTDNCPKCGVLRTATIPFAHKGYRGLESEEHACGSHYKLTVFRPVGETKKEWDKIFGITK